MLVSKRACAMPSPASSCTTARLTLFASSRPDQLANHRVIAFIHHPVQTLGGAEQPFGILQDPQLRFKLFLFPGAGTDRVNFVNLKLVERTSLPELLLFRFQSVQAPEKAM